MFQLRVRQLSTTPQNVGSQFVRVKCHVPSLRLSVFPVSSSQLKVLRQPPTDNRARVDVRFFAKPCFCFFVARQKQQEMNTL